MNRKHFLSSIMTAGAAFPALAGNLFEDEKFNHIPTYLRAGDIIGITCPAGFITADEIQSSVQQMESWGFQVKLGETVGKKDFSFGGTDEQRAADFQQMLDDPHIKAIMCARGGYGAVRIIDDLDWTKFRSRPKWIIGFSDITVVHCHLNRNLGIASIHSKMCNSFPDDWAKAEPVQIESILSIRQALTGESMSYQFASNHSNRNGKAQGVLVGGNLKTLETLSGTKSDIKTTGKILFVEDTGEYLYSIDRMFWNLQRTGKLESLSGLVIGGFKVKPDDPGDEFGRSLEEIVLARVKGHHYPVCFDFPVGHQKNNFALKCGVRHNLEVLDGTCVLSEIR